MADNRGDAASLGPPRRKVEIANYHLNRLLGLLKNPTVPTEQGYPPVDVQAHFEGVLFSVKAEIDQVTKLLATLHHCPYKRALQVPQLREWRQDPLFEDLNEVRRRAVHHEYRKQPSRPKKVWKVQKVGSSYTGSRELGEYCRNVVRYGEDLIKLIERGPLAGKQCKSAALKA